MGLNKRLGIGSIHNLIGGRSTPDAHPQTAITGLDTRLTNIENKEKALTYVLNADTTGVASASTIINALITLIGSDYAEVKIPLGNYKIGANVTFPKNIDVRPEIGTIFNVDNGVSFSAASIKYGAFPLFAGSGTISLSQKRVHAEWFGILENTDSSVAFQKCIDSVTSGTKILVSFDIIANGIQIIDKTIYMKSKGQKLTQTTTDGLINVVGNYTAIDTIVGFTIEDHQFVNGQNTKCVKVESSNPLGLVIGQAVKIISDDYIPGDVDNIRQGEHCIVGDCSGNYVWLTGELLFNHVTNPRIAVLSDYTFKIDGFVFASTTGGNAYVGNLIGLTGLKMPVVENCSVLNGYGPFVGVLSNYGYRLSNCTIKNLVNVPAYNQYGYGVADSANFGGIVENCLFVNCRHGYTTSGSKGLVADSAQIALYGCPYGAVVKDSIGEGCSNAPFDTHPSGDRITFINCTSKNTYVGNSSTGAGFQTRTNRVKFINCYSDNDNYGFYIQSPNVELQGCKSKNSINNGIRISGSNAKVKMTDCEFDSINIYTGQLSNIKELEIYKTKFINRSSDDNSAGIVISNTASVVFAESDDTVTLAQHGLKAGEIVSFTVITTTTGIVINTNYYVVGVTDNTFQVSLTKGGSAINLTNDGTGTISMITKMKGDMVFDLTGATGSNGIRGIRGNGGVIDLDIMAVIKSSAAVYSVCSQSAGVVKGRIDTITDYDITAANRFLSWTPTRYTYEALDNGTRINNYNAWNTWHPVIGSNHLWIDSNGDIRLKAGVPSSDTDGQIIGSPPGNSSYAGYVRAISFVNQLGDDGNFGTDTNGDGIGNGWTVCGSLGSKSMAANEQKWTASASGGGITRITTPPTNAVGDKIYVCCWLKSDYAYTMRLKQDTTTKTSKQVTGSGAYEWISVYRTAGAGETGLYIELRDDRSSAWTETAVKFIHHFNLTTMFGAGLCPDQAFMDWLMKLVAYVNTATINVNVEY